MDTPSVIKKYLTKPVAILGSGSSGHAVEKLLQQLDAKWIVYDEKNDEHAKRVFDEKAAKEHSLVVCSPGFSAKHPWMIEAAKNNRLLIGELDFASIFWKGPMVAITGTNGKTTITQFLAFALKRSGVNAVAAGNIGFPLSNVFESGAQSNSVCICEVSSFQSETMRFFKCDALVWTNFDEDHLDRYATVDEYFLAKWKLLKHCTGRILLGQSVADHAQKMKLLLPENAEVFREEHLLDQRLVENSPFRTFPQSVNFQMIKQIWPLFKLPEDALYDAANNFSLPKYRLSKSSEIKNVQFWNDSKGTNFHATHAALQALEGDIYWIGGGYAKGGNVRNFAARIAKKIKAAYLIGANAEEIKSYLEEVKCPVRMFKTLDDAVYAAGQDALKSKGKKTKVVLLSPGFASFDMFKSYEHRGISYEKAVLSLNRYLQNNKIEQN